MPDQWAGLVATTDRLGEVAIDPEWGPTYRRLWLVRGLQAVFSGTCTLRDDWHHLSRYVGPDKEV